MSNRPLRFVIFSMLLLTACKPEQASEHAKVFAKGSSLPPLSYYTDRQEWDAQQIWAAITIAPMRVYVDTLQVLKYFSPDNGTREMCMSASAVPKGASANNNNNEKIMRCADIAHKFCLGKTSDKQVKACDDFYNTFYGFKIISDTYNARYTNKGAKPLTIQSMDGIWANESCSHPGFEISHNIIKDFPTGIKIVDDLPNPPRTLQTEKLYDDRFVSIASDGDYDSFWMYNKRFDSFVLVGITQPNGFDSVVISFGSGGLMRCVEPN